MKNVTQNLQSAWNTSRGKFLQSAPVSAFNLWYRDQNTRDRKIIKGISAFVVLCLIMVLFVLPFLAQQGAYKTKLDKLIALMFWTETKVKSFTSFIYDVMIGLSFGI